MNVSILHDFLKVLSLSAALSIPLSSAAWSEPSKTLFKNKPAECHYDPELLQSAKQAFQLNKFKQVLEISSDVLVCSDGMAVRTLIELYKARGGSYYHLFRESFLDGGKLTRGELENALYASIREYQEVYAVIRSSKSPLNDFELRKIEESWSPMIKSTFELASVLKGQGEVKQAMGFYEIVLDFLVLAKARDSALLKIRAISGFHSGDYYLKQSSLAKAKKYLTLAIPIDKSYLQMSDRQLQLKIPFLAKKASLLYYNLGGIYYNEMVQLNRQQKLEKHAHIDAAVLYFRLSHRLDPNNMSAKRALSNVQL